MSESDHNSAASEHCFSPAVAWTKAHLHLELTQYSKDGNEQYADYFFFPSENLSVLTEAPETLCRMD